MKDDRRERLLDAYDQLTAGGGLPTAKELAKAARETPKYARYVLRETGLPYQRERRRDEAKQGGGKTPTPWRAPMLEFDEFRLPAMTRILEIKKSGDPSARPERMAYAGEGSRAEDRTFIVCPVCGVRTLIAPRMHPFWLRNRAGEVIFVDKEACTGRAAAGY